MTQFILRYSALQKLKKHVIIIIIRAVGFRFAGKWQVVSVVSDPSMARSASYFIFSLLTFEYKSKTFFRNVDDRTPNEVASYPSRPQSSTNSCDTMKAHMCQSTASYILLFNISKFYTERSLLCRSAAFSCETIASYSGEPEYLLRLVW